MATYPYTETHFANQNWKVYEGSRECPMEEEPTEQGGPVEEEGRADSEMSSL